MDVVVLAGGLGTRMKPYTIILPKPLLPLGDKPILERLLIQLRKCGVQNVYLSVGHLSSLIMAYFGDGNKWDITIHYIQEEKRLGTAGPLSLLPEMKKPFLVVNGDLVTNFNFFDIYKYHIDNESVITIGVHRLEYKLPLGYLDINNENIITDYIEKPIRIYDVSMGIYVCNPSVLKYIKKNERLDFPDLTKALIAAKEKVMGYQNDAYWFDVGRPESYEKACDFVMNEGTST